MRVACETPAPATGGFVCELKAEGEEESEHEFNKDLAIAKQLKVGRFVSKIDSDGPVFAGPFGYCAHVSPQVIRSRQRMRHDRGNTLSYQDHREGLRALPLKAMECGRFCKKQQMQWSKEGAHLLLQTRVRTLNGELGTIFKRWYPDMDLEVEEIPIAA
jgi:hypothetical protein